MEPLSGFLQQSVGKNERYFSLTLCLSLPNLPPCLCVNKKVHVVPFLRHSHMVYIYIWWNLSYLKLYIINLIPIGQNFGIGIDSNLDLTLIQVSITLMVIEKSSSIFFLTFS